LKTAGYDTYYFENYNLDFQNTGPFIRSAGYDTVHGIDLMRPGDPLLKWGYREDIFFKRVGEYLTAHPPKKKSFIHIVVGASNHYDFKLSRDMVRSDVLSHIPYPIDTPNYIERRKNALFVQDAYLEDFWNIMNQNPMLAEKDIFVYGDHPVSLAESNLEYSYNADSVEEKSFRTAMLFVPAESHKNLFATDRVVSTDVGTSHRSIAPTILSILGIPNPYHTSTGFYEKLVSSQSLPSSCTIDAQPFYNAAVSLIQYPYKVVLRMFPSQIEFYDLSNAAEGESEHAHSIVPGFQNADSYFEACFKEKLDELVKLRVK
jgi:hypothetical protein